MYALHYECALKSSHLISTILCQFWVQQNNSATVRRVDFARQTGRSQSWDEDDLSVRRLSDLYLETVWKVKKCWLLDNLNIRGFGSRASFVLWIGWILWFIFEVTNKFPFSLINVPWCLMILKFNFDDLFKNFAIFAIKYDLNRKSFSMANIF